MHRVRFSAPQSEGDEGGAPDKHTGMSARLKAAALDILEGNGDASEVREARSAD